MRLRRIPKAEQLIKQYPEFISVYNRGEFFDFERFSNYTNVHLEIGMGKGQFLYQLAELNPSIMFVGVEKYDSVIYRALQKQIKDPLDNLFLVQGDADYIFDQNPIKLFSKLYLNFSDPWPKERHAKRRLTHHTFLKKYKQILKSDALIEFKTDNEPLYRFSVNEAIDYKMNIIHVSEDLHQENKEVIMTEFEERFTKLGQPIFQLIMSYKGDKNEKTL
jgi:tRNA (guanine-N7-)-methyltransferase